MSAEARSVVVRLSAETAQYIAQMQAAGRISATAMKPAEAAVLRQSAAIDDLGGKAGRLGVAAGAGLAAMGAAAISWESQWAGVTKTVDGTSSQLNQLEDDIRGLARSMPATHAEIAATAEAAGQLGVATDDVADFTEVMVMMGETTNLSADGAATSIAQFMNVLQSASDDVDEIGNTIVDLGNKGASTEGQIVDMAQRVAGAGATIGATEADVLGLSAAMANLGIQSELGGGAVQRVLLGINTAVSAGSDHLYAYADAAGTSAEGFARAWAEDPVRAFDMLVQGLGRIQDSGGDVASVLEGMGIKGTQNLQVMLRLAGSGDMLSRSLDQSAAAWEENDALTTEYGKRAETTASQVQVAWNQIKDAAIEGGAAILPVVADIASGVGTIATAYGDLPGPIKDITTGALALTAVLGGGLWFGSKVVNGVTSTRASLAALRPEISRVGTTLATRSGVRPFIADLGTMASTSRTAGATTQRELARVQAASQRVRSTLGTAALRGGGLLGGIALASTDAAEGLALTNTASYALMGMLAGPWGAALGAGVGLIKDFRDESKSASKIIDGFNNSLDDTDVSVMLAGFQALQSKTADLNADLEETPFILSRGWKDGLSDTWSGLVDIFGDGATELNEASDESVSRLSNLTGVLQEVAAANNDFIEPASNGWQNLPYGDLEDLARIGTQLQPVLEDLGYSLEYLMSLDPGSSEAAKVVQEINDALAFSDSDAGRVEAVGGAIEGLGNELETTADRAEDLKDALDDLLGPQMGLSEATDAWTTALRHLDDDLAKNNRTLEGNSDAAIKNRAAVRDRIDAFRDLLIAEANAGAGSKRLERTVREQRQALLDAGEAAGISREQMREYINQLGLTPAIVKTLVKADTRDAERNISSVGAWLESLDGKTATTYIRTIRQGYENKASAGGADNDPTTPYAAGGHTGYGPRGAIAGVVHGREYVFSADATEGNELMLDALHKQLRGYSDGGYVGDLPGYDGGGWVADMAFAGERPRSLEDRMEIVGLFQQIRDLRRDLARDGKNRLTGLDRQIASLQLETAQRDLRRAQNAEEREARQKAREEAREARELALQQRQTRRELSGSIGSLFDGIFPAEEQTRLQEVTAAIADFRSQWLDAGGTWTKDMREWAREARTGALYYDRLTVAIETETAKRDALTETLADQQSQLESLNSTMAAYADTVASKFLSDPFNGARTDTIAGAAGPATAALEAARAELAAVRALTTGDSVANAARAADLIAQIRRLQPAADAEVAGREVEVTGLEALRETVEENIDEADRMTAALTTLASKGLDTEGALGALYQGLAASGDVLTAEQLAVLSQKEIDEYERLFAAREDRAATLGALATQAVYGQQQAQFEEQIANQTRLIDTATAAIELLTATQAVIGDNVRLGAEDGVEALEPQFVQLNKNIRNLARELAESNRTKKP